MKNVKQSSEKISKVIFEKKRQISRKETSLSSIHHITFLYFLDFFSFFNIKTLPIHFAVDDRGVHDGYHDGYLYPCCDSFYWSLRIALVYIQDATGI